jgi:uncharacterized damage-inducible protein DinB
MVGVQVRNQRGVLPEAGGSSSTPGRAILGGMSDQERAAFPLRLSDAVRPPEEPPHTLGDPRQLLAGYLDYYRATVLAKLDGLSEEEMRGSRLPSGWSPLELLWHLAHVERRWLVWGFLGEDVPDPWGDWGGEDGAERWRVPEGLSVAEVAERFREQCERSRAITGATALTERAPVGGRFADEADAPTMGWILFHLLQEYARHAGHLDIVRELADGTIGE